MTDMLKVLGTFAAAMLLMAPAAFAQGGREGRGRGGRRRGEASGRGRERMLERFDEDGDGKLSDEERAAAREAFGNRRPQGPEGFGELQGRIDTDGDGVISEEEREAALERMVARMLERFDKDGDGSLSAEELKALVRARLARMRQRRPGRPPRHRPGPSPWSNEGGEGRGDRPHRQGPPRWSNEGGRADDAEE